MTQTTDRRAPSRQLAQQSNQSGLARLDELKPQTLQRYEQGGYPMIRLALIQQQIARDATLAEFVYFMERCISTGLDPLRRQIYFVKRRDSKSLTGFTCAHQVGIDGFRAIAESTGLYAGSDAPEFSEPFTAPGGKDGHKICRVTVWKIVAGVRCPFVGEARWDEFYPGEQNGSMWRQYPHNQLAKCAESQGLRKGFPVKLGELSIAVDDVAIGSSDAQVFDAALSMGTHTEPEYMDVTDRETGEIKQVRAGDEWERLSRAAGEEMEPVEARQVVPPEPPAEDVASFENQPAEQRQRRSRQNQPVVDPTLCTDPECLESGRPAKAMDGTDPPRCFGHNEHLES